MTPTVVVLSAGRAGRVRTLATVPFAALCVPEREAGDYRATYPRTPIIAQPGGVKGLAACRQWLYETHGDLWMLDDDVVQLRTNIVGSGEKTRVPTASVPGIMAQLADLAAQLGAYLYGFGSLGNPVEYTEHHPFSLTGYQTCVNMGLRAGSKLWFRPDLSLVDDFWISGLNAFHHRFALIDLRYTFVTTGMFKTAGGLAGERTSAGVKHGLEQLRVAFGSEVIQVKRAGTAVLSGSTAVTVQHEFQPQLVLPF